VHKPDREPVAPCNDRHSWGCSQYRDISATLLSRRKAKNYPSILTE
jgi:hypothetical protein